MRTRSQARAEKVLTYGIELEFVFAFHEDQLDLTHLGTEPDTIQKHLIYHVRETPPFTKFNQTRLPNHVYNSWGVLSKGHGEPKPYDIQPQIILSRNLKQRCPQVPHRIEPNPTFECKSTERYDKWIICGEPTVCGRGSELHVWLKPLVGDVPADTWDSIGLEAISPVFSTDKDSKEQIMAFVKAIKGTSDASASYASFITNQCGTHVHVGAQHHSTTERHSTIGKQSRIITYANDNNSSITLTLFGVVE